MKANLAKRSRFVSVFISFTLLLGVFQAMPIVFPKLAADNAAASDTTTPACPVIDGTAGSLSGTNPIRCTYSNVPNNTSQSANTPIGAYVTATLSGAAGGGGGSDGNAPGKAGGAGATITATFTVTTSGLFFCIGNGGGGGTASASGNGGGSAGTNPCDSAENGGAGGPAGKFGSSGGGGGGGAATFIANSVGTRLAVAGGGGGGAGGSNAAADYGTNTAGNSHGGGGSGSRTGGTGGSTSGTAQYVDDLPGGGGGGGGVVGGSGGTAFAGRAGADPREGYAQGGKYGTSSVSATPSAGGGGSAGALQSGGTGAAGSISFYYEGPTVANPTLSSSSAAIGTTLTATEGSISTNNTATFTTSWQWYRQSSCTGTPAAISGATTTTYTPTSSDLGSCLTARQTSYDVTGAALGVTTISSATSAVTSTVTFDANGGTGSMTAQTSSAAANLTANSFTRTGYTFANWNTAANASGTSYNNQASYPFTASATLYAQWTANPLTVTYDSQLGSAVTAGSTTTGGTISAAPTAPTRSGYAFGGWATSAGGTIITFPYTHGQTASFTLYAIWVQNPVFSSYTLKRTGAPDLTATPGSGAIFNYIDGATITLTANASVSDGGSLTYLWFNNVSGEPLIQDYSSSPTITIPSNNSLNTYHYSVKIKNTKNGATSITSLAGISSYYPNVDTNPTIQNVGTRVFPVGEAISDTAFAVYSNLMTNPVWSITGTLPAGVTFNSSTAKFEGTPTTAGQTNLTVSIASDIGKVTSSSFLLSITKGTISAPSSVSTAAVSGSATSVTATYTLPTHATSVTAKVFDAATGGNQIGSTITNFASGGTLTVLTGSTTYYVELTAVGDSNWNDTVGTRVAVTTNAPARAPTFTVDTNVSGSTASTIYRTTGQSVTFSVTAVSPDGGTLSYQWLKDGVAISGATSSTLALSSLTTSNAAAYSVTVTASFNGTTASATSTAQSLTVASALTLTTPVSGLTGNNSVAFTALTITASGGRRDASSSCAITTGSLPTGLSIALSSNNCQISGTPTATGTFAVVATITDTNGATASTSSFSIVISDIAPGQPTILGSTTTSTSISLSFSAGSNSGSPITKYQYSTDNGVTWVDASGTTSPLAISSLTLYTTYQVKIRAFNSIAGAASSMYSVTTQDVQPAAPTINSITPTSTSLSVAFTAGTNSGTAITKYQYSTDGGTTWADRTDSGTTASPLVITKLSSNTATSLSVNTSYNVKIRAFNSASGLYSSQVTSSTSNIVPNAPTSVTGTRGDSSVVVSWTVPTDNGGSTITGYTATSSPGSFTCYVAGASSTSCTVSGLTNGTAYTFTVVATNSAGNSSASTASASVTPATNPGAPTSVSATSNANTQSVVTWTAPTSTGGSAITDYVVEYSSDSGSTWTAFSHTASTSTSMTITGLTNGTSYLFHVAAKNSIGTGSFSTNSSAAVPATTPGAPTNVTSTDFVYSGSNNGTILVSWSAPSSNGGAAITDYVIEYSISNNGVWNAVSHTASTATSLTVTGISAMPATYNFRISAKNAAGTGTVSTASPGMVLKKPATPSGSATSGSKTSLSVTFTSLWPIETNVYLYTSSSGGSPVASSLGNSGSTVTFTGLTEGTTYYAAITSSKSAYYTDSPESDRFAIATNSAPQAPTITTQPVSTNVTSGSSYTLTIAATSPDGGTISYQWKRDGTNVGTGTTNSSSLAVGTYNFTVDVTNTKNGLTTVLTSNTATVRVYSAVSLSNLTVNQVISGTYGTAFSYQLGATGGLAPYTYSYGTYSASYTLPPGVTLNSSTGLFSGTPTTVGNYSYLLGSVTDSLGSTSQVGWFSINIGKATLATPSAPTVSATTGTLKSIDVSWSAVANATSYLVKLYSGATNVSNKTVSSGTSTTYTSTDYSSMGNAVTYTVKIQAIQSDTTNYNNSAESTGSNVTTNAQTGLTPTFGSITRTASGFTFSISNYDANYSWAASASTGSASVSGSTVTITGLSANTSSTITVTSSRTGYTSVSADKVGTSLAASSVSVALAGNATTATVGTAVVLTATADQAGTVTFKQGGNTICSSVAISASPFTATCSWTPTTAGTISVTADFSPTASSSYATSTSSAVSVTVGRGTLSLPTGISVTATAGSTSQILITLTVNSNATNTYVYEYADATTTTEIRSYGVLNGTTYKENLTAGTTYYYEIVSGGDGVNWNSSAHSIRYSATTGSSYTVTYSLNGLTGYSVLRSSDSYVTGGTAITLTSVSPSRTGYTDLGWYDAATGGNKIGNAGATYTPSGSITLYYQWTPTQYTVTYNAGTGGSGAAITQNFDVTAYPTLKTLSDVSATFTKTGYHVSSWNTNTGGTGTSYALGATTYQIAANLTLYAIWTVDTYAVTFNSQGGSSVTAGSFTYGGTVSSPTAPTYSGYVFMGWFTAATGGTALTFPYTPGGTSAITLYAQWKANPTFTSIDTNYALIAGGQTRTITGTNLDLISSMTVGGTTATITSKNATTIVFTTPSLLSAGSKAIALTYPTSQTLSAGNITYYDVPAISSISSGNGFTNGGETITITGTSLSSATAVKIGGVDAASFTVISDTSISFVTPVLLAGNRVVSVTTLGGSANSLGSVSIAVSPPTITSQPSSASKVVGESVTFTVVAATPSDGGTLSYQWQKAGSNITGATSASYTFTTSSTADAGSYTVIVKSTQNSVTSAGTSSSTATLTMTGQAQTITFTSTAPTGAKVGGSTYTVTATGGSSGNTVTFTSLTTTQCTISTGVVTFKAIGTCTIAANQSGNTTYAAATQATQDITVAKGDPNLGALTISAATFGVTTTVGITDPTKGTLAGTFAYTSGTTSVATVSGSTLTVVGAGSSIITATFTPTDTTNYNTASVTGTFTVNKGTLTTPSAPTFLSATTGIAKSINATLTAVSNASSYTVQIISAADGTTVVATITGITSTTPTLADSALADGTAYKLKVQAIGGANYNSSSLSSLSASVTTNATYTITYNNGSYGYGGPLTQTHVAGATSTLKDSTAAITRTGYSISGWATSNGGAQAYALSGSYSTSGALSLYPVWTANTYTVTFDSQGGSSVTASSFTYGGSLNAPAQPTYSGYVFAGWFVAATGGSALTFPYSPSGSSAITLYAQWAIAQSISFTSTAPVNAKVAGSTYTVTATGGASGNSVTFTSSTSGICSVSSGVVSFLAVGTCTIAANQAGDSTYAAATQTTQSFTVAKGDQTQPNAPNLTYTPGVLKSLNVSWTALSTASSYTVKIYDAAGATLIKTVTGLSGTSTTILDTTNIANDTSYTASVIAVGGSNYNDSTESSLSTASKTAKSYSITYNTNSPTGGTAPTSGTYISGAAGTLVSANTGSLSKSGYTFVGWNTSADGTGTDYAASGSATYAIAADITLYAKWSANTITITYSAGTATGATGTSLTQSFTYASPATERFKDSTANLTRSGYYIGGWSTLANGSTYSYQLNGIISATSNITVYPYWIAVPTFTAISKSKFPLSGGGGANYTVTGTSLSGITAVTIGGSSAGIVSINSSTDLTIYVPSSATAGAKDIVFTYVAGTVTAVGAVTYYNAPTITSFTPTTSTVLGGTTVTVTGTYLSEASAVTLYSGVAVTSYTVVDDNTITFVSPAITTGNKWITIVTPGGSVTSVSAMSITKATPSLSSFTNISKNYGDSSFTLTDPTVGGSVAGTFSYSSGTTAVATISASTVTVAGLGTSVITATFTPTDTAKYNTATITMTLTVSKGNIAQPNAPNASATSGTLHSIDLTWTAATGAGSYTAIIYAADGTTVIKTVTGLSGTSATIADALLVNNTGYKVTITAIGNSNYNDSSASALSTLVTTANSYSISYNSNSADSGSTPTSGSYITGASGTLVSANSGNLARVGFTFTGWNTAANGSGTDYAATGSATYSTAANVTLYAKWTALVPTITSFVSTTLGTTSAPYGDTVTITGTNFSGATSVSVGATAVSVFTVVSSTSITFTSNKSCCSVGKVSVTTPGGTATSTQDLTPLPQVPVITTQPADVTKAVGQSVTFTVVASSPADGGTLSYQWKKGTSTIVGATSASYSFTTSAMTDAGNYWVIVTNTISSNVSTANSNNGALTMTKGSQATLTVTSTSGTYGTPLTLTYSGGTTSGAVTFSTATSGCSISAGELSTTSAKTCVVTATMSGNTDYNDVTSSNTDVIIGKASQATLSFSFNSASANGCNTGLPCSAFNQGTNTNPINIPNTTSGSGTGQVTITVRDGTATGCYLSNSNNGTLSTSFGPKTLTYNFTSWGTPTVTGDRLWPYWQASTDGTCIFTATKAGDSNYLSVTSADVTFTFSKLTPSTAGFTTQASSTSFELGNSVTLTGSSIQNISGSGTYTFKDANSNVLCVASTLTHANSATTGSCTWTPSSAATYSVKVYFSGDTYWNLVTQTSGTSITVNKTSQSISFTAPTNKTYGDTAFTVSASATSNLTVTFASSTSTVCTVSGTTVTILTAGTCTLTANQSGDATYAAASQASQSITVAQASQSALSISATTSSAAYTGSAYTATPTFSSSGGSGSGAVTYSIVSGGSASSCALSTSAASATLTASSTGTCLIAATKAASTKYLAATSANLTFTFTASAQTISFTQPADKTYGDADFTLTASATSTLSITFASSTTSVCTVSGNTVSIVTAGTCTLTADQSGNSSFAAAPTVTKSLTVSKKAQVTLNIAAVTSSEISSGTAYSANPALSASGGSGTGSVTYAVVTGGSATSCVLSSSAANATLTASSSGTCLIAATMAADTNYLAAISSNLTFTFAKKSQAITFATLSSKVFGSGTFTISATSDAGLTPTFTSGTSSTCTISGTTVTLVAAGTCTINADQIGDTYYAAATQLQRSFTISLGTQATLNIAATSSSAAFNGSLYTANPAFSTSGGSGTGAVTYAIVTGGTATCTLSSSAADATLSATGSGTCYIAATKAADSNYNSATSTNFTFTFTKATLATPADPTVTAASTSATGLSVNWVAVANAVSYTVYWYDSTGTTLVGSNTPGLITTYAITGLTENTAYQVSIKANGTGNYTNSSESNKVSATTKARPAVPSVSVVYQVGSGSTTTITSGNVVIDITQGQTFTATVTASTTDSGSVVMVRAPVKNGLPGSGSNSGSATSFSVGAVINNTYNVGSPTFHSSSCPSSSGGSIICTAARNTLNGVVLYSSYIGLGLNVFAALTATTPATQTGTVGTAVTSFTPSVSGGKANYTYQRVLGLMPPGLSLDANTGAVSGTPTASGVYSIVIRVTEANGTSIDVTVDYTITALSQSITFNQLADKTFGDADFSISATSSSSLSAVFTSATTSVCTVTGSTVHIVTAGTCTLNANQPGDSAYSAATQVQQSFIVNKTNQATLNITSTLSSAAYTGSTFTAVPTFANNGGSGTGAVTYAIVTGGTAQGCALSSSAANATLTATSVGTCLIAATKATSTNYLSATSANLTFTFTATSQTITFTQPVNAVYGVTPAALSATSTSSLTVTFTSATLSICTVSGTTVTLLTSGTCTINADQAGDSNFASATQVARSFTVAKADPVLSALSNVSKTYGDSAFNITDPTVTGSLAGTFTYSSGSTSVATISGSSVTPVAFGSSVITALFTPTDSDKYNTATTTFALSVAARTLAQPNAPDATATAGSLKSIAVTWTAVTYAVAYTLKIYAANGTTLLQTVAGLSGTSKTITATEFSAISDNVGYKIGLIATGDTNNADSLISNLSSLVTTNKTYVISYNANSSTSGTTPTSGSWITGATASNISSNSGTLIRTGYTFAGWNSLANGSGTDYAATGSATYSTTADLTLYAKWTANGLTITYKSDYLSGPVDITETKTADTTFTLRGNTFTRPGYNFSGWALSSGGLIAKSDSATSSVLVDTSYYAGWTAIDYTVTYDGNGNTGGVVPTDSAKYNIGGSVTVKGNTGILTRTGYSFAGWTDNSGNTGTVYSTSGANTTYSVSTSSITLYAKWSKNTYFISYDVQGGSSAVSSTYQIGDTVTLPSGPTKTGYTFAGWFAAATGGTTLGSTYAPSGVGNITIFAQWTPIAYRVYYSSNNGNSGTVPSDSTNYNITYTVTVVGNTANAGRTGYTWAGWNTSADGSGTTYQATATFTMGSADVTLYAKWTAINYTITYNGNGFTSGTVPANTNNYNIGGTISIAGSNGIARTGYTFLGWTVAADGTGTVMTSGYGLTVGSSDLTVYAKWSANSYTITYLANGASGSPSATSATYTTDGTAVTFPTVGTMQKAGHSFSGWATTSSGPPLTSPYTTASDVTLVAVWTAINYTISYNSNGGSTTPTQSSLPMGQSFALASGITKPNGSNGEVYAFVGWSDGSSTWQPGSSYLVKTANVSFTALWVQVFEVNYILNGATSSQPSNQLKNDGDVITLAAAPTRTGYEFQGWTDQSGQSFAAGATYTVGIIHYTLNAVWAAINYTITYDAAGGSVTPQQSAKNVGQTFYLANAISRTGYTFNGWDDGTQTLGAGSQVLVGTSNLSYTAQWTANVYTVTYDFNGGTGSAIANASYTFGTSALTLPLVGDRVRTNYTFGGWSTTANGASVGLTFTPSVSTTLYAVWTLNQYVITYNGNSANVSNTSATYTAGSSALTLPAVTRAGFVFNGWYSSSSGGSLIGQAGASYLPSATGSIYAKWTQLSLSGVSASDLSFISSTTANANIGVTSTFTTSTSSASVSVPAGSLPDGTVISYHLLASNASRTVALPAGTNYVLSLVVSWVAPDGSVPTTASNKPIAMTVSSSSIKKGASVYAIAGSSVQFLGVATQDGSVLVNITDDPEVAIVKTKPSAPLNVSGYVTNGVGTVTWSEPLSSGGSDILGYEVSLSGISTPCITNGLTCSFTGLTAGTSYTVTVRAFNAIDYSAAGTGSGSGAFTLSVPAPPTPPAPAPTTPAPAPVVVAKPSPAIIPTLTSLIFEENATKDGGKLIWMGTNIESVLFTGSSLTYPAPYNYGAFTITWNGNLVNMIPGVTYKMKLEVRSATGGSDSKTIEYTIAKPVVDTSNADAALKIAKDQAEAEAKAKAEAQALADKIAREAKAAADLKAAEAKAAADAAAAAALKAAQQLADAKERALAELKAKEAKAAEEARIAEELRKAKEKADAELKLAAEKKALEDAAAAAALAAKKIIPEITLYSISSKLTLSAYDKAYLNKYISTLKSKAIVTCIGYYYLKNTTLAKAKARAKVQATAICKMIKKAKPSVITKIAIYSSGKAPKAAQGAKWVAISYRVDSFKSK